MIDTEITQLGKLVFDDLSGLKELFFPLRDRLGGTFLFESALMSMKPICQLLYLFDY